VAGRPRRLWSSQDRAGTDDFGQPTGDRHRFVEPSWTQICAMGFEVPGVGVIPGDVVAAITDRFDTHIRRVLLDTRTGVVAETGTAVYRPSAAIRRHVELRDGTCRFPGCARRADRCELDHVIAWPQGPTTAGNLQAVCKHHHRAKHQGGWAVTMTPAGLCTWTDPFGQQFITHPVNHHELAA